MEGALEKLKGKRRVTDGLERTHGQMEEVLRRPSKWTKYLYQLEAARSKSRSSMGGYHGKIDDGRKTFESSCISNKDWYEMGIQKWACLYTPVPLEYSYQGYQKKDD